MILIYLLTGVIWFLRVLSFMIIANALLSWFLDPSHPARDLLARFVNPILRPIRTITDRLAATSTLPIDLSPILAYFALVLLMQFLSGIQDLLRYRTFMY
jgi:YggT family protein